MGHGLSSPVNQEHEILAAALATNRRDASALSCPATVRQFHHTRRSSSRPHGEGSWEVRLASRVQSLESGSATIVSCPSDFGLWTPDSGLRPADCRLLNTD